MARLQNEIAPPNVVNQYEKWFENAKKIPKKIRNVNEHFKASLLSLKHFSPALSKSFHRPKLRKKMVFHREALQGWVATLSLSFLEIWRAQNLSDIPHGITFTKAIRNSSVNFSRAAFRWGSRAFLMLGVFTYISR